MKKSKEKSKMAFEFFNILSIFHKNKLCAKDYYLHL